MGSQGKADSADLPHGFHLLPNKFVAVLLTNKNKPNYREVIRKQKREYKKWYEKNTGKFGDELRIGK